jgi:hypothetical protein
LRKVGLDGLYSYYEKELEHLEGMSIIPGEVQ